MWRHRTVLTDKQVDTGKKKMADHRVLFGKAYLLIWADIPFFATKSPVVTELI